jgi:hypothetical protein
MSQENTNEPFKQTAVNHIKNITLLETIEQTPRRSSIYDLQRQLRELK